MATANARWAALNAPVTKPVSLFLLTPNQEGLMELQWLNPDRKWVQTRIVLLKCSKLSTI